MWVLWSLMESFRRKHLPLDPMNLTFIPLLALMTGCLLFKLTGKWTEFLSSLRVSKPYKVAIKDPVSHSIKRESTEVVDSYHPRVTDEQFVLRRQVVRNKEDFCFIVYTNLTSSFLNNLNLFYELSITRVICGWGLGRKEEFFLETPTSHPMYSTALGHVFTIWGYLFTKKYP